MSPPAKKRRFVPDAAPDAPPAAAKPSSEALAARHAEAVRAFREDVSALVSLSSSSSPDDGSLDGRLAGSVLSLATLKSLQRLLARSSSSRSDAAGERRERAEAMSLALEAVGYERRHLRGEVDGAARWRADGLAGLAWSELGIGRPGDGDGEDGEEEGEEEGEETGGDVEMDAEAPEGGAAGKKSTPRNDEEAIDAYLFDGAPGRSHRDPAERDAIVTKLNSDLEARGDLVAKLSSSRSELAELKRKRDELRGFLDQIPKRVGEMDRTARGLGEFFTRHGAWDHADAEGDDRTREEKLREASLLAATPSSARGDRFRLASSNLPSPLYALFVQLEGRAGASDALSRADGVGAAAKGAGLVPCVGGIAVEAVQDAKGGGEWNVALTVPTSGILDAESAALLGIPKGARPVPLRVVFSFDSEACCVLAKADGDEFAGVLDGLFPGDDGSARPNAASEALGADEEEEGGEGTAASASDDDARGKPYYWCQVLAGLDIPPPPSCADLCGDANDDDGTATKEPFRAEACAGSFLRSLLRRLRARQSLTAILDLLSRGGSRSHPLPVHPSLAGKLSWSPPSAPPRAKLHSWTAEASPAPGTRAYAASVRRKGCPPLRAAVTFDPSSYPAAPPVWSLRNEDGSTGGGGAGAGRGGIDSLHADAGPSAPPLVDAALRSIESRVNADHAGLVDGDDERSFDWVLLHQLGAIVSSWDGAVSSAEGEGANAGGGGGAWTGRDRAPAAGALRLYRGGL